MTFKQTVYRRYQQVVNEKISLLETNLRDLRQSASNETKSTAGDKHETALAMLQIEQENTARQLGEVVNMKAVLDKIDPYICSTQIVNGSLVKTNKGYLFICIAMGKILVDDIWVVSLSPQSPLGASLMGLHINETAGVKGYWYIVEEIL